MRNRINIIFMAMAVLSFAGCGDYLGIKPRGYDVACRIEHYEGLLYGTENTMVGEVFPYMTFELETDAQGFGNIYSLIGREVTNAYKWEADIFRPDEQCTEWNNPASLIYPLNIVVNEVMNAENGSDEEKLEILSEARMLRAAFTFFMAQFFGKPYDEDTASTDLCVPLITEAATIGVEFPRKTVKEIYDFVLKEMNESVSHLPGRSEHPLRVFSATGYAMLGKVYWMMGDYESALWPFSEAMKALAESGCGFLDYNAMVQGGEITYPVDDLENPELLYNFESMSGLWSAMYPSYYGSTLFTMKTDVLHRYFQDEDLRLCFISGLNSRQTAYNKFPINEIYYQNMSRIVSNHGISVPDLYLMYSECLARTGDSMTARTLIEELRRNRMDPSMATVTAADGDELVRFIVEERIREYLGYGNLWFDMRRLWDDPLFQDLKDMYTHTDGTRTYTLTRDRLVMRIPPSVMEWHPEYSDNI